MMPTRRAPVGAATLRWRGRAVEVTAEAVQHATRLAHGFALAVLVEALEAHQAGTDDDATGLLVVEVNDTFTITTTAAAVAEVAA